MPEESDIERLRQATLRSIDESDAVRLSKEDTRIRNNDVEDGIYSIYVVLPSIASSNLVKAWRVEDDGEIGPIVSMEIKSRELCDLLRRYANEHESPRIYVKDNHIVGKVRSIENV